MTATDPPSIGEIGRGGYSRVLSAVAANAVALWGVYRLGWSGSTLLALYWVENVLAALLVSARLLLHRAASRKRGYARPQLGVVYSSSSSIGGARTGRASSTGKPVGNFLTEFAVGSLLFSFAHGVLLFVFLGAFGEKAGGPIDLAQLKVGALGIAVSLAAGFLWDLVGLSHRSFRWAREIAQYALGRVVLLHLVLLAGAFGVMVLGQAAVPFLALALLKTLSDVGSAWPRRASLQDSTPAAAPVPGWLRWMGDRFKASKPDLVAEVQADLRKQQEAQERDEEVGA